MTSGHDEFMQTMNLCLTKWFEDANNDQQENFNFIIKATRRDMAAEPVSPLPFCNGFDSFVKDFLETESFQKFYRKYRSDGEFWTKIETGEKYPVQDFRVAVLFEFYRQKRIEARSLMLYQEWCYYDVKKTILKSGEKIFIPVFMNRKNKILTTFLHCDVPSFYHWIKSDLIDVITSKKQEVRRSLNVCRLQANWDVAEVSCAFDYCDMGAPCKVDTMILLMLVDAWMEDRSIYMEEYQ